jgi:hypothetical protein
MFHNIGQARLFVNGVRAYLVGYFGRPFLILSNVSEGFIMRQIKCGMHRIGL